MLHIYFSTYLCLHTFGYVHGVQAAQQVSDIKAVSLLLSEPVVTSEVEPQVRPDHIRHHHPVQEPVGAQARVVMLDPEGTEEARLISLTLYKTNSG